MDRMWYRIQRHLRKTDSLQIILASITIHSILSIAMIYLHLGWYFDYQISKFEPNELSRKEGGIVMGRRRHEINLVSSDLIKAYEMGYTGWWREHSMAKWAVSVHCFPQKWILCAKVFSTTCKSDRVRGIYQNIPIRKDVTLQNIELSLRANADQLSEQSGEASYGLHAVILLSNGATETVKLEFPTELDQWTKRSVRYSSPPGTRIVEMTMMLICVGYFGTVSFSDIAVIPLPESGKWGTSPSDLVAHCASHGAEANSVSLPASRYSFESLAVGGPPAKSNRRQITLVTQASMDRLTVLEKTLQTWSGPVSLAVYIPVKDIKEELVEWQRLYIEKKVRSLNLTSESHVELVIGSDEETDYPINLLRNVAIKSARTKYVLLIDADFQACPDLEKSFMSVAHKYNNTSNNWAFVVPAFEYLETPKKGDGIPKTKEEFLQLIFRTEPMVQPFRVSESVEAHRMTDYWKWFNANSPYHVRGFSDKYEPYLITERSQLPLFDEHFTGYGMNKVSHATELYAAKYKFVVLHNLWITHLPHKSSTYSQEFLQNGYTRLKNRAQRFQFIRQLFIKYKIPQKECFY